MHGGFISLHFGVLGEFIDLYIEYVSSESLVFINITSSLVFIVMMGRQSTYTYISHLP